MKNLFIILFISSVSLNIMSQKKWNFGAEAFPNYTHQIIINDGTADPLSEQFWREREIPKFCLSGQIYVSYNFSSNSSLSVGVGYQNTGNRTKKLLLSYGDAIDPRLGFTADTNEYNNVYTHTRNIYNHHSIQIPILYQHTLYKRLYVRGGLNTIFNMYNTTSVKMYSLSSSTKKSKHEDHTFNVRKVNLSGQLSLGYIYFQSNSLNLYIQTTIERSFLGISTDAPLNRTPFSWGLILGAKI